MMLLGNIKIEKCCWETLRLKNVGWQVFLARRNNPRDKALQKNANVIFWENFFKNANALPPETWFSIDG